MAWPNLLAAADRVALQTLGATVRYAPSTGQAVDVQGIFDAAYVRAGAGEAGVASSGPAVFLRLEDLPQTPAPEDDDPIITVGGVTYRVREAQPDGQGGVLLHLHRT